MISFEQRHIKNLKDLFGAHIEEHFYKILDFGDNPFRDMALVSRMNGQMDGPLMDGGILNSVHFY